ncbi:MAG: TerC family protein [Verrucomicrobia bacterium]|nr:TerC family protein [Verrucomicrobiota bacterium]
MTTMKPLCSHSSTCSGQWKMVKPTWRNTTKAMIRTGPLSSSKRKLAYEADVTYGTASEFGFDFLRDRLKLSGAKGNDKPFWTARIFQWDLAVSGKDLILLLGGLFLITKSTREIHGKLEGEDGAVTNRLAPTFVSVIIQIMLIDIVFSLDSVITAVGMVNRIGVMIAAVVLAMIVMVIYVEQVSAFVERHPTIKMLALSFLILIGTMLVAEGCHQHVNKGYIYFAMAFSVGVEMLNLRLRRKQGPKVALHQPYR